MLDKEIGQIVSLFANDTIQHVSEARWEMVTVAPSTKRILANEFFPTLHVVPKLFAKDLGLKDGNVFGFDFAGDGFTSQPEHLKNIIGRGNLGEVRTKFWSTPFEWAKIPLVGKYGLTGERDLKDLAELCKSQGDEMVLDHERDEDGAIVVSLNLDLAIEI